jgi:2-succinyl-5-enolpyruvyl-6-hydroxy-3-cyclohexene-1-carboxylate synthase
MVAAPGPRPAPAYDVPNVGTRGITDILAGRDVLVVVGGRGSVALSKAVNELANRIAAPVIADPQANVTGPNVLEYGELVVAAHDVDGRPLALDAHRPDVVLRLGPIPTVKPLWAWMERSGADQLLVHSSRLTDPLGSATTTIDDDPLRILAHLAVPENDSRTFLDAWTRMDRVVSSAVETAIRSLPFPNEPAIARTIAGSVPDHSILFVGSSRPIRDLAAFGRARAAVTVIANRGVNGIDGAISTALGAALTDTPTTLYIGDVTALHDVSALAEVQRLGAPLRIVVVNNDGGGIFSFLPQAGSTTVSQGLFERHWGTPHGLEITPIAAAMGLQAARVSTQAGLTEAVSSGIETPELIEVFTDRSTNPSIHMTVHKAVAVSLDAALERQL